MAVQYLSSKGKPFLSLGNNPLLLLRAFGLFFDNLNDCFYKKNLIVRKEKNILGLFVFIKISAVNGPGWGILSLYLNKCGNFSSIVKMRTLFRKKKLKLRTSFSKKSNLSLSLSPSMIYLTCSWFKIILQIHCFVSHCFLSLIKLLNYKEEDCLYCEIIYVKLSYNRSMC